MDDEPTLMIDELEQEFMKDDCMLLLDAAAGDDGDIDAGMDVDEMEVPQDAGADLLYPLPPLEALLGAGIEGDEDIAALFSEAAKSNKKAVKDIPTALEKLAQSMRQSEVALREHATKLRKAEHAKIFDKYQDFFTGGRMTITPELEQSRQRVWTMIHHHQKNVKHTAAA